MKFDDLKNTWMQQQAHESASYSEHELLEIVNHKMSEFDNKIRWRDRLEIVASIIGIIIFGITFFYVHSWLTKLGCAVLVFSCLGISYKLIIARLSGKSKSYSFDKPMLKQLYNELYKVKVQKKLLKNVLWWYLLPIFVGLVLFTIGMSVAIIFKIVYLVIVIVVYAYIWKMNENVVHEKLDPIIGSLNEAIKVIEKRSA